MGITQIIQLIIAYGPGLLKLLQAAEPLIEELRAKGLSNEDAASAVLGAAVPDDSAAVEAWRQRASRE